MQEAITIQRALLAVSNKAKIVPFAQALHAKGILLLSTGQTASLLRSHEIPVESISTYTGFPEMMEGRLKTLHPKIHGGILGRRDHDRSVMEEHHIPPIDLVVVTLYPFEETIQKYPTSLEKAIETIDIGGPTLIRGAAKNHAWCSVLVDPADYEAFLQELSSDGTIGLATRRTLAAKAFARVAAYDSAIAHAFASYLPKNASAPFSWPYQHKHSLRYGENPHQTATLYTLPQPPQDSIAAAEQLQGKPLSYNNFLDSNTALECVKGFEEPTCVIVKHANPCGVATGKEALEAYQKAYHCDPISAFGGIVAFNRPVDRDCLHSLLSNQFVEIVIAPHFTNEALAAGAQKPLCRLLRYTPLPHSSPPSSPELRSVSGGVLMQSWDLLDETPASFVVVTTRHPTQSEWHDLLFAWRVVSFVKSNAIVFAKEGQTLGIGAGQPSRVLSTEIAVRQAKASAFTLTNAVMASDAFFPFPDSIEKAHAEEISSIIQPGGSKRDQDIIRCANKLGLTMVFTGRRHFKH